MERKGFQQGDVLLISLGRAPKNITPIPPKEGKYILFEGEYTGHLHAFEASQPVGLYITPEGKRFLEVLESTPLSHHGHYARDIAPGWYEVDRVQEIDPFTEEIKNVVD